MGGKSATSTQSVAIPPSVLAQYNSVNANAEQVASQPFQQYSGQFVAPVNAEQSSGIAGTNAAANEAQPYYAAAKTGLGAAQAATNPVNAAAEYGTAASSAPLTGSQIDSYLSPYLNDVMGSTSKLLGQQNEQAQSGQLGNAIRSGAFGGDRTGIAAANLNQQNQLASANILSGIANQGYQSALSTAQGQQQIGLAGAKQLADIGSTAYGEGANTASEMGALGSGAQSAGLQGAQAQIAAGTVQQQTQQAQDTAQYQQFLQQQSYPFQTAQFLANIAEGTGALSGSTTTTTQPGGFFSDERLKEDMEPIGKTFDGQPIYRYKMKGDPRERIGLSAQQVEKKHPEAVGLAGGYKWVDYGQATEEAANRSHFYEGGVVPFRRQRYADGGSPGGLDSVLEAQRNMYAPPQGGGGQRNIPSSGTSHQLAVAQGTPAPPPSGSSKVSQSIGLGKDAYQGYKYFNKPAAGAHPASSTGLSPAGAQPSGATTYGAGTPATASAASQPGTTSYFGPAADTGTTTTFGPAADAGTTTTFGPAVDAGTTTTFDAGLGAADTAATGAATDAAAGAATSAAEGAAASGAAEAGAGAAAGAATGAVAAGAADAAATEAAVLAAEYAATYAAMAAVAAKRGGRIKKYATGGSPYSYADPDGGMAVPDEEASNAHLQSPGALVKQPTGLQTASMMGDPQNWSKLSGSMFSNTAMATGGVAGRRGYDDGGTPDDNPDAVPSAPNSAPAPAAATEAGATGVAPPKDKHWWQKSENILPILSGLAAMGTERTVHPGVAIAAGLGAGAESYLHTRSSQAKTAEEQQRAKGLEIANQIGALKVKAAKDYLDPTAPVNPYAPAVASSLASAKPDAAQATADGIEQMYRNKYQTTPWTPDEQAAMKKARGAAIALGNDQPVEQAKAAREQRVQNQTYANQKAAQVEADQLYKQATDPSSTQPAREAALVRYNALHQWTGDQWAESGGQRLNSRTGAPAIGAASQVQTLGQKQEAYARGMTPLTLGNGLPGFLFQQSGFRNIDDFVAAQPGATTAQPGSTGAPGATPIARPAPVAPARAASASAPAAPAASTGDKYLDGALSDPAWRQAPLPRVVDQTTRDAALKQQDLNIGNRNALLKDSEAATNAGATAMQYLKAAKSIMDSKGATVGAYGSLLTNASRWMGGGPQSTNYQELAKYLGNAAAQQAQANFPGATQSEVHMQFNELSPNVSMDDATIKKLLNTNIRSTDYALKSASHVKDYLAQGNEPTNFAKWNQKYYDRDKLVNAPMATNAQGQRLYFVNGKWVP